MSQLIRRSGAYWPTAAWESSPLMQDLMRWDPFTALSPTPPRWETVGFSPHFDVGETLPDGADLDACEAELKNGVLFISIPKRADHRSRSISITAIGEKVKGRLGGKDKGQA